MLRFDFETTIREIVEAMLPRFSPDQKGLVISMDLRVGPDREPLHFLFVRPNNYTKVMWSHGNRRWQDCQSESWKMSCDHDSCWSSDGLRPADQVFRNMVYDMDNKLRYGDGASIREISYVTVELEAYKNPKLPSTRHCRPTKIEATKNE